MKISDLIRMGLRNLGRRKARTALTVISVVIGSISIITMISIGIGMNANYQKQVMEMGSLNTITISKYQDVMDDKGDYMDFKEQKIDKKLLESIKQIEHVKAASPTYNVSGGEVIANNRYNSMYSLNVVDFTTLELFGAPPLSYGSYPTEEELSGKEYYLLLGSYVVESGFYDQTSRVFKEISVDPAKDKFAFKLRDYEFQDPNTYEIPESRPFKMTPGVFESTDNYEYDYSIYIDSRQYEKMCQEYMKELSPSNRKKMEKKLAEYQSIKVCVDNVRNVDKVRDAIKELGYYSSNVGDYTKSAEQTSKMLQMVLGAVGAVAMLVSAISIANTMIMSIYERTKEIGVMKVLGCIVSDIKKLFLFESAMMGLIGGGIGIVISYILSFCINRFGGPMFEALMSSGSLYGQTTESQFSIIPIWLPFGAALFAMLIGIISGYYPAKRATKISAIEAMKTEG